MSKEKSTVNKAEDILKEYYGRDLYKLSNMSINYLKHELLIKLWELNNKLIAENEELKNEVATFNLMIEDIKFDEIL